MDLYTTTGRTKPSTPTAHTPTPATKVGYTTAAARPADPSGFPRSTKAKIRHFSSSATRPVPQLPLLPTPSSLFPRRPIGPAILAPPHWRPATRFWERIRWAGILFKTRFTIRPPSVRYPRRIHG